jgi:hypothetical protein
MAASQTRKLPLTGVKGKPCFFLIKYKLNVSRFYVELFAVVIHIVVCYQSIVN